MELANDIQLLVARAKSLPKKEWVATMGEPIFYPCLSERVVKAAMGGFR